MSLYSFGQIKPNDQKDIILLIVERLDEEKASDINLARDTIFVHFLDTAYARTRYFYHKNVLSNTNHAMVCDKGAYNGCLFIYSDRMRVNPGRNELYFKFCNGGEYKGMVYLELENGAYKVKDIDCCSEVIR